MLNFVLIQNTGEGKACWGKRKQSREPFTNYKIQPEMTEITISRSGKKIYYYFEISFIHLLGWKTEENRKKFH